MGDKEPNYWVLESSFFTFNSTHPRPDLSRKITDLGEGPRGPLPPFFFLYFPNVLPVTLRFCFENRFIKCSLILSSETLTLLYFASRIRPQCCMLHVPKSKVFIWAVGWRWGEGGVLGPLFLNFLDPPLLRVKWS